MIKHLREFLTDETLGLEIREEENPFAEQKPKLEKPPLPAPPKDDGNPPDLNDGKQTPKPRSSSFQRRLKRSTTSHSISIHATRRRPDFRAPSQSTSSAR